MDRFSERDVEPYLDLSKDELYLLLVPESAREQVYTREGLIARGQTIFARRLQDSRDAICGQYHRYGSRVKSSIDLVVLVANALLETPQMAGVPVLPVAALVVKTGLEELCRDRDGDEPQQQS